MALGGDRLDRNVTVDFRDYHQKPGGEENDNFVEEPDDDDGTHAEVTRVEFLGAAILLETLYVLRWHLRGMPIENKWDLVLWNVLCRTARRGRHIKPEHLALAVKLAWLDYEDPIRSDLSIIIKYFQLDPCLSTPSKKNIKPRRLLTISKAYWLDLVRDARAEVDRLRGIRRLHRDVIRTEDDRRKRGRESGTHARGGRNKKLLSSTAAQLPVYWSGKRPKERKGFQNWFWQPHRKFREWLNPPEHTTTRFANPDAVVPGIHGIYKPIVWYGEVKIEVQELAMAA